MSISEYYLRNWPAPVCPLNTLQSVAPHTRGALAKCLPRNSGTGRGMRWKTTAQLRSGVQLPRSIVRQKGTGCLRARSWSCSISAGHHPPHWPSSSVSKCRPPLELYRHDWGSYQPHPSTTISNCFPGSGWFPPPFFSAKLLTHCLQLA